MFSLIKLLCLAATIPWPVDDFVAGIVPYNPKHLVVDDFSVAQYFVARIDASDAAQRNRMVEDVEVRTSPGQQPIERRVVPLSDGGAMLELVFRIIDRKWFWCQAFLSWDYGEDLGKYVLYLLCARSAYPSEPACGFERDVKFASRSRNNGN